MALYGSLSKLVFKLMNAKQAIYLPLGQNFLLVDLQDLFSDLGLRGRKKKKKSSENGHFQRVFFISELFFFFKQ